MVDTSGAVRRGHPIFFVTLLITSFIAAVIASTLISKYHDNNPAVSVALRDKVAFSVFANWWIFIFSAVFLGTFLAGVGGIVTSIASHFVILFLSWIFSVAAAGSLTAQLNGGQSCSNSTYTYCNSLEALLAFNWINWILITIMLGFVAFIGTGAFRGGRGIKEGLA